MPSAEADIDKQRARFAACATHGRQASAEITWIVPPSGKIQRLTSPEPEIHEWCLVRESQRVAFTRRPSRSVAVHLRVRVDADKTVSLTVTEAELGKAVICDVSTGGAATADTASRALELAPSMTVCYRQAQRSDPSQTGDLEIDLGLRSDGTVSDVQIDGKRRTDLVRDCVRSTVGVARFPAASGPARVGFSVRFVPE